MNEKGGNHLSVEGVRLLRPTDNRAEGHLLVVEEEVTHKSRFTRATTANENHYGILWDFAHIELF